jgi:hypothetical protein
MRELHLVLVLLFAALGLASMSLLTWEVAARWGFGLVAAGHLFGLPAALRYHLLLRAELLREGQLERGWFWHPNRYHGQLREPERSRILWWWYAGGAGFVAVVLGLLIVAAGLWSAFREI